MFKKTKIAALSAAVLGLSSLAIAPNVQAVSVNENGATGQVLIFPYYNVNNGFITSFNITNTVSGSDGYKAVKIRFRESKLSNDVLDFNLYMSPDDVFTMTLSKTAAGGVLLTTEDKTCTHPTIPAGGVEFRDVYTAVDAEDMREGYLEVIEMGVVTDGTVKSGILHSKGVPNKCSSIAAAWSDNDFTQGGAASNTNAYDIVHSNAIGFNNFTSEAGFYGFEDVDGLRAPTGGLAGSSVLVDLNNVAGFVVEPTAITNYSTRAQHYLSSDQNFYLLPSLASGTDHVSDVTADDFRSTKSITWSDVVRDFGLDDEKAIRAGTTKPVPSGINPLPISHAMAATSVANQYFLSDTTSTDFVIAAPMKKHGIFNGYQYAVGGSSCGSADIPVAGDDANGCWQNLSGDISTQFVYFDREEAVDSPEPGDFSPPLPRPDLGITFGSEVNILALSATGSSAPSVLGSDNSTTLTLASGFKKGWGKFDFSGYNLGGSRFSAWVGNSGGVALGVPLSGFMAARGTINGQRVGETFPHIIGRTRGN